MENKRITPKEFSNKSQNDEILKKQLELQEREIALKEKEMELKMLQRDDDNSIGKEKMLMAREGFRYTKYVFIFFFAFFVGLPIFFIAILIWQ